MKKFLIIILALAMLCTFAACDNAQPVDDPNVVDEEPEVNKTVDNADDHLDGRLAGQYAEMMMNGHYYMESTSYVMGMEFSTIIAVDG